MQRLGPLAASLAVAAAGACTETPAPQKASNQREHAADTATVRAEKVARAPKDELRNENGSLKQLPGNGRPEIPGKTAIFRYEDFAPQVAAFSLGLGFEWYQDIGVPCPTGGSHCADDAYDIKVVIYRGIERAAVEKLYPTVKDVSEYRLAAYEELMPKLDAELASLSGEPELEGVRQSYLRVRERIQLKLAPR